MTHSVLLVDDEQSICRALKRTFRKSPYTVYQVNSGDQALELLKKTEVDVIISDQRMPGMNGTELLTIVKEQYPSVGRVMLSGQCDFSSLTHAVNEANIFRFMEKPWNDEELLNTVDETIAHINPTTPQSFMPTEFLPSLQPPQSGLPQKRLRSVPYNLKPMNDVQEAFFKKQQQLEKDIKDDELKLIKPHITDISNLSAPLHYCFMQWPRFQKFSHDHIIDTAKEAGYLKDLYTWYILHCADKFNHSSETNQHVVIDIFCEEMITDKSLRSILLSIMRQQCHMVFRIPFHFLENRALVDLLKETYISSSSIMLNIGKRIIDVNELKNTPVDYLEMDARFSTIRNPSITKKRIKMLKDAQKLSIKTILSEVKDPEQLLYAKKLNKDFFSSKLHNGTPNST